MCIFWLHTPPLLIIPPHNQAIDPIIAAAIPCVSSSSSQLRGITDCHKYKRLATNESIYSFISKVLLKACIT